MDIDFDPAKDAANLSKHGLPLRFGVLVLADPRRIVVHDERFAYGEARYQAFGVVGTRVYVACFTLRDGKHRFISVRKANRREQHIYHQTPDQP